MPNQLTERQQQIQALLDKGKSPAEIAGLLKPPITANAVYQQLRRMHGGKKGKRVSKPRRSAGAPSRLAPAQRPAPAPAPTPAKTVTELRDMTPLQAIRARRTAIEAELREADNATRVALTAAEKAKATAASLHDKRKDELSQLVKAESALTGKPVAAKPKAAKPKGSNGSGKLASVPPVNVPDIPAKPAAVPNTTEGSPADASAPPADITA